MKTIFDELKSEKKNTESLTRKITKFCKENDITKNGKTYTFKLGTTTYRVSNHKCELTGTKNNYTMYNTYRDSGKSSPTIIFIYDNENKIIEIYNKLVKEYKEDLAKSLKSQVPPGVRK